MFKCDLQWLSRAGTGSERVWRQRRLGWEERSWQRKHTGDRKAGHPSTSPPTSRTHCAYCTTATHRQKHKISAWINVWCNLCILKIKNRRDVFIYTNLDEYENTVCVINFNYATDQLQICKISSCLHVVKIGHICVLLPEPVGLFKTYFAPETIFFLFVGSCRWSSEAPTAVLGMALLWSLTCFVSAHLLFFSVQGL